MAKIMDIYSAVDKAAPFASAMDFDNVGLLVGSAGAEVTRALICLDITRETVEEAKKLGAQLIISHHPVIFEPLKKLEGTSAVYMLAENKMSALCCHTNLDLAPKIGVNVALGNRLGFKNIKAETARGAETPVFSGELDSFLPIKKFIQNVSELLETKNVTYINSGRPVRRVAFASGAGFEFCRGLDAADFDTYLTGEAKHHEFLEAKNKGMNFVFAGHYATEKPFGEILKEYLGEKVHNVEFVLSEAERNIPETL